MKNMRQPLDYLRRWPRTKRRAVLADANAIRDLQGSILLNSKSAYCKLKEWKGSRSHNSSSSRRDARGHVTTSSRKRNTSDCDSESDSDMSLMIVPAKQSRKVVARPGKILAPKNFKGMTTVCRDNTLIWLKVIEDV